MLRIIDNTSWDAIENTEGDVVLTIPPSPRPRLVLVAADAVYVVTDGLPIRLVGSATILSVVSGARTVVIAEADERIHRETLVAVAETPHHLEGQTENELEAA
jgi:hypothetical protein